MKPAEIGRLLAATGYIADDELSTLVWMGLTIDRPLLLIRAAG